MHDVSEHRHVEPVLAEFGLLQVRGDVIELLLDAVALGVLAGGVEHARKIERGDARPMVRFGDRDAPDARTAGHIEDAKPAGRSSSAQRRRQPARLFPVHDVEAADQAGEEPLRFRLPLQAPGSVAVADGVGEPAPGIHDVAGLHHRPEIVGAFADKVLRRERRELVAAVRLLEQAEARKSVEQHPRAPFGGAGGAGHFRSRAIAGGDMREDVQLNPCGQNARRRKREPHLVQYLRIERRSGAREVRCSHIPLRVR